MAPFVAVLICLAWVGHGSRLPITSNPTHSHLHEESQPLQRAIEKTLAMLLLASRDPGAAWQISGHGQHKLTSNPRHVHALPHQNVQMSADLIEKTDHLHSSGKVDEYFNMLQNADTSDKNLAWRIARAYHDKAEETISNDAEREKLLRKGTEIAEAAREEFGDGLSLKWYAILLGRMGDFLPTKEKVANSYKIKDSLEAAASELPEDRTVQTALGQWCYKIAGIGFVERQAAKLLFGKPPQSSYEEALKFFLKSYELSPSKKASYFAGMCYKQLKKKSEANEWLNKCLSIPSVGEADIQLDKDAKANIK